MLLRNVCATIAAFCLCLIFPFVFVLFSIHFVELVFFQEHLKSVQLMTTNFQ